MLRRRVLHDAVNVLFAEQTFRAHQQKQQRQHVRKPVLDTAAGQIELLDHDRAEKHFGEFFADPDDQPTQNRARYRCEAAKDHDRQRLQRDQRHRKLHSEFRTPHDAGHQRDKAGDGPDDDPDPVQWNADRLRGLMIVATARNARPVGVF